MSAAAIASSASARGAAFRRLAGQELLLAVAIVALAIVVGLVNPRFLATRNLSDILLGNAYIAIAAVGMSMVIISGNIDISVGALIGVLATISGSLAVAGAPSPGVSGLTWTPRAETTLESYARALNRALANPQSAIRYPQ